MTRRSSGRNPEYTRRLELREARRAEVERMIGFSSAPARAWGKRDARVAAIRRGKMSTFQWKDSEH